MADSSSSPRYSEQEMALILKRAAELQEGADGRGAQLSLSEIQTIAAEVGIAPSYVTEAAAELQHPTPRIGWLGAPTRFHDERTVRGKLSTSAVGELIDCLRSELGLHGEVTQVLDTIEWRGQSGLGTTFVTLAPRGGDTRIAVTTSRTDHAVMVGVGSFGIGLLAAIAGLGVAMNTTDNLLIGSGIIAGAGVVGTVASARLLWQGAAARWRRRTQRIVGALADRAAQSAASTETLEPSAATSVERRGTTHQLPEE